MENKGKKKVRKKSKKGGNSVILQNVQKWFGLCLENQVSYPASLISDAWRWQEEAWDRLMKLCHCYNLFTDLLQGFRLFWTILVGRFLHDITLYRGILKTFYSPNILGKKKSYLDQCLYSAAQQKVFYLDHHLCSCLVCLQRQTGLLFSFLKKHWNRKPTQKKQ